MTINQEHLAFYREELRKRGYEIVGGPEVFELGDEKTRGHVERMHIEGKGEEPCFNATESAFQATRVHFGLPPGVEEAPSVWEREAILKARVKELEEQEGRIWFALMLAECALYYAGAFGCDSAWAENQLNLVREARTKRVEVGDRVVLPAVDPPFERCTHLALSLPSKPCLFAKGHEGPCSFVPARANV